MPQVECTDFRGQLSVTQEMVMRERIQELGEIIDKERHQTKVTQEKIDKHEANLRLLKQAAKNAAIATGMTPLAAQALDDIDEVCLLPPLRWDADACAVRSRSDQELLHPHHGRDVLALHVQPGANPRDGGNL
jgi:hypothetical protein